MPLVARSNKSTNFKPCGTTVKTQNKKVQPKKKYVNLTNYSKEGLRELCTKNNISFLSTDKRTDLEIKLNKYMKSNNLKL